MSRIWSNIFNIPSLVTALHFTHCPIILLRMVYPTDGWSSRSGRLPLTGWPKWYHFYRLRSSISFANSSIGCRHSPKKRPYVPALDLTLPRPVLGALRATKKEHPHPLENVLIWGILVNPIVTIVTYHGFCLCIDINHEVTGEPVLKFVIFFFFGWGTN